MFKEVDMTTAIMAAVKGLKVLRITENDVDEEEEYIAKDIRHEYLEFLLDDSKARFLVDDPDYKVPEPLVFPADEFTSRRELKEAEHTTTLHFDADDISDIKPGDEKPKAGKTAKKDIDIGKVTALHNAGWSIAKIADEMHVYASVIQRRLAALERAKNV